MKGYSCSALISGTIASAWAFGAAAAVDLPGKNVSQSGGPVSVVYNWTGFYLGGTVSYAFGDWSYTNPTVAFTSATNRVNGVVGGPTVGFNWQAGVFVFGAEGDYSWSKARGTDLSGCNPGCQNVFPQLATVRVRAGYAADRFLFYVTSGAAFTRSEIVQPGYDVGRKNLSGWTIGGGLEWAFTQSWSAKIEYLHLDFGNPNIWAPVLGYSIQHHDRNLNIVRLGVNYRFF